jgi:hypothetical protein
VEVDLPTGLGVDIVEEDDDLAVTNILEGVADFFDMYCTDGIKKDEVLVLKWSKRMAMEDLSGGNRGRRRREWWLGICYSASAVTGIPIHELGADDIRKAIEFQGSNDQLRRRLGLDRAMENWTMPNSVEDVIEKKVLDKIRSYFNSEVFSLLMVDAGITHKALKAIKAIDAMGIFKHVNSKNVIERLNVSFNQFFVSCIYLREVIQVFI